MDGTGVVIVSDADGDGVCDADEVAGCQDADACDYNPEATDSAACEYDSCAGCTSDTACNYDATATLDNGSCVFADDLVRSARLTVRCCCPTRMATVFATKTKLKVVQILLPATSTNL